MDQGVKVILAVDSQGLSEDVEPSLIFCNNPAIFERVTKYLVIAYCIDPHGSIFEWLVVRGLISLLRIAKHGLYE